MRPRTVSDEDILEAARACLLEYGPSVPISTIAGRLGVSAPAVLKRFGTKERLVLRALVSDAPPDLSHGPGAGPLRPQIIAILLHVERLVSQAVPRLATLRAGGVRASQWLDKPHPRRARENFHGWLKKAQASHGLTHTDLEGASHLLISLVEARGFLAWVEPGWVEPGSGWAARAVDAVFGDLGPSRRARTGRKAKTSRTTGALA